MIRPATDSPRVGEGGWFASMPPTMAGPHLTSLRMYGAWRILLARLLVATKYSSDTFNAPVRKTFVAQRSNQSPLSTADLDLDR